MMNDMNVNFPDYILDRFSIEGIIVSSYIQTLGWAFLSENENQNIILRIYLIEKESNAITFEVSSELSAFRFTTRVEMKKFYKQLLSMSALEYMILLNDTNANNLH